MELVAKERVLCLEKTYRRNERRQDGHCHTNSMCIILCVKYTIGNQVVSTAFALVSLCGFAPQTRTERIKEFTRYSNFVTSELLMTTNSQQSGEQHKELR